MMNHSTLAMICALIVAANFSGCAKAISGEAKGAAKVAGQVGPDVYQHQYRH